MFDRSNFDKEELALINCTSVEISRDEEMKMADEVGALSHSVSNTISYFAFCFMKMGKTVIERNIQNISG